MINLPYDAPLSLFDLTTRGVDRYKANYDSVFKSKRRRKSSMVRVGVETIPVRQVKRLAQAPTLGGKV